jgi:hypothetical protein
MQAPEYSDAKVHGSVGSNSVRLANSSPFLVDYNTGTPITTSQVHWISNNQYAAQIAGTPYPGSGRSGDSFNNVDASVFKTIQLTEHVTLRLEADAFNVLNRSYYGTPDKYIGDLGAGSFNNFSLTPPSPPDPGRYRCRYWSQKHDLRC